VSVYGYQLLIMRRLAATADRRGRRDGPRLIGRRAIIWDESTATAHAASVIIPCSVHGLNKFMKLSMH
jgi:hypothetical protein